MKVTRTSGLPIDDVAAYKEELDKGMVALTQELGRFEKAPAGSEQQREFLKRFEELKEETLKRYPTEVDWEFETVMKSKSKLKELCNIYGVIAFSRDDSGKLQCWIVDSRID